MSYEEEIAFGVQAYLDVDLQFPQEDHVREATKKVQTNADHIRAMSDEELAENISEWQSWGGGLNPEEWLKWLRKPAKEDA